MKKTLLSITTLAFVLFVTMTVATAQTSQEIAKIGRSSSVSLTMNDGSTGSGFFVLHDQIATCYHVIEGTSSGYISPVLQLEKKYSIVGITAIDKDNDLVILKISDVSGTPLSIGDSDTIEIQDEIYAVGHPLGLKGTEGTVTHGEITNVSANRILMDANISPGNSGGALLNTNGEVVGVVAESVIGVRSISGKRKEETVPATVTQSLNIAVPSKYLKPLIEKAKVPIPTIKPLSVDGVTARHLIEGRFGIYLFTVHNQRAEAISNLHCLIIFKDNKGVICSDRFKLTTHRFFFAGQAIRTLHVPASFDELLPDFSSDSHEIGIPIGPRAWELMTDYEIRILDFDIAPDHITRGYGIETLVPLEKEEVSGSKFTWAKSNLGEGFSYFLQNHSDRDVKDVSAYVVFYDKQGDPIGESLRERDLEIPAMGTLKVEGSIGSDVKQLTERVGFRIFQSH